MSLLLCFCDVFWVLLNSLDFDSEPEWTKRGLNLQVRAVSNRGSRHGGDPGLHWPSAGMVRETCAIQEPSKNSQVCRCVPDSKYWFTTSFLQPLPYLVTPQGPENCQLTSSSSFCWCSNSSKFVTKYSNYSRRLFYD